MHARAGMLRDGFDDSSTRVGVLDSRVVEPVVEDT